MGIPVGKRSFYNALGGVRPSSYLSVTIHVGTDNEKLLNDEFYIRLRQKRATEKQSKELLDEFMLASLIIVGGTFADYTFLFFLCCSSCYWNQISML